MSTLVLTCAGASSRYGAAFPPKWSIRVPSGLTMGAAAVARCIFDEVVFVVREKSAATDTVVDDLKQMFRTVRVHEVGQTASQVETVRKTLPILSGSFAVKDGDNAFPIQSAELRYPFVAGIPIATLKQLHSPASKSWIVEQDGRVVVAEKAPMSSLMSCGAYGFSSPDQFARAAGEASYLSQVISALEGVSVLYVNGEEYHDWGDAEAWRHFLSTRATLFVDVDGVLIRYDGKVHEEVIQFLREAVIQGRAEVIVTTARPYARREETETMLRSAGLFFSRVLYDLPPAQKRVVVNDVVYGRAIDTAAALNVSRDDESAILDALYTVLGAPRGPKT